MCDKGCGGEWLLTKGIHPGWAELILGHSGLLTEWKEVANVFNKVFFGEKVVGFSFDIITHIANYPGIYY